MKTILTSMIAMAGLLATVAGGQPTAPRTLRYGGQPGGDASKKPHRNLLVFVITNTPEFGVVDAGSGAFLPIGPGLPPDVGSGLVPGRGASLLTLTFSGNLDTIDPRTGKASVVGHTGLSDCSTPASPCGPNSANVLGQFDGTLYATDFANNLYSVDPKTANAKLIGPTGIPALPFIPGPNPDGTVNVYDESLFSAGGKLYANFGAAVVTNNGPIIVIPPAIYREVSVGLRSGTQFPPKMVRPGYGARKYARCSSGERFQLC